MTTQVTEPARETEKSQPLRIWPALALLALVALAKAVPYFTDDLSFALVMFSVNAPLLAVIGILLWWMFASRARSRERWLGPVVVACIAIASYFVLDAS